MAPKHPGTSLVGAGFGIVLAMVLIWIIWTVIQQVVVYEALEWPNR